jgi:hypothetical protein
MLRSGEVSIQQEKADGDKKNDYVGYIRQMPGLEPISKSRYRPTRLMLLDIGYILYIIIR